jgi:hypothetical protein
MWCELCGWSFFYYVFNYNGVYSLARWMRTFSWNEKRRRNKYPNKDGRSRSRPPNEDKGEKFGWNFRDPFGISLETVPLTDENARAERTEVIDEGVEWVERESGRGPGYAARASVLWKRRRRHRYVSVIQHQVCALSSAGDVHGVVIEIVRGKV